MARAVNPVSPLASLRNDAPTATRPGSMVARASSLVRSAKALREMKTLSFMSLARRLRVSLPLALLAATVLLSCHTLAPLQQLSTDGEEDMDVLPRVFLQVWIPCSCVTAILEPETQRSAGLSQCSRRALLCQAPIWAAAAAGLAAL